MESKSWTLPALLFAALSTIPFLLPMADIVPKSPAPVLNKIAARRHSRVALIIVDSLGLRKALQPGWMPYLQARVKKSACGVGLASFPTITGPGLRALISGHRTVFETELPGGRPAGLETDSVFARAASAGLRSFVLGQFSWEPIFKGHGAYMIIVPYNGLSIRYMHGRREVISRYDEELLRRAEPVLDGRLGKWDFLILHFFELDPIGHVTGTESELYRQHMRWVDKKIEEISHRLLAQAPTTILLVGDHGMTPAGTHGGIKPSEREVPFMLWGDKIRPVKLGNFPHYNAAPTLSALLGIPPPAMSEGWPMLDAIKLSAQEKTEILLDLLEQRRQRWNDIQAVWPWLRGDPASQVKGIRRFMSLGKYDIAAHLVRSYVQDTDNAILDALPEKWFGRLVAALWCLVLSACFGLAWRRVGPAAVRIISALALFFFFALLFPLWEPNSWAWASALILASAIGLLALSIVPGFGNDSRLAWGGWGLWWLSMAGLSMAEIVDVRLWSWLIVWAILASRWLSFRKRDAWLLTASLAAMCACAALACREITSDVSLLRSLLPIPQGRPLKPAQWLWVEGFVWAILSCAYFYEWRRFPAGVWKWLGYILAIGPMSMACLLMLRGPLIAIWSWAACLVSLIAAMALPMPSRLRGVWLSLLALAFYRTMSMEMEWCFVAMGTLVGWSLADQKKRRHPLWAGMALLGVSLWSYSLTGAQLRVSSIVVKEGYRILGQGWHPYTLVSLIALKYICILGAPLLPWLADWPMASLMGSFPLLGALSAGNLGMLWWDRFMAGMSQKMTDKASYVQIICAALLAWILFALWAAVQGIDRLSARLSKRPKDS